MMIKPQLMLLVLLLPGATALSFTEDFEGYTFGGFNPDVEPDQEWYDFNQVGEAAALTDSEAPILNGGGWLNFQSINSTGNRADFDLVSPSQLTNLTFTINGSTVADDGEGSRQVVRIQSSAPVRTLVEFYVFCADATNPTGCSLKVRFENVDSTGQTLIEASTGDQEFLITILPDWTTGQYRLFVDGVDDGLFPFLELPNNIGRVRLAQYGAAWPMTMSFDDWFIDGALEPVGAAEGDAGRGLQNFATSINFTNPTSLFLLGLVFFAMIILAVGIPMIALGLDNTVAPALAFVASATALWLVLMEWWPDWVGIALIILVAALISLTVRSLLMGIRDASTGAGIVAGSLGYFIIATSLLGFSGYATDEIVIPSSALETPDDIEAQTNASVSQQSFAGAVTECLITFFSDCSTETESTTWATITDVAGTVFNFARTAFTFLFQLLTFSLPIPVIFNAMIVLPPAAALATVGFGFITGGRGS